MLLPNLKKILNSAFKRFLYSLPFCFTWNFFMMGFSILFHLMIGCFTHYSNFKMFVLLYCLWLKFFYHIISTNSQTVVSQYSVHISILTAFLSIYHQACPTTLEELVYRIFTVSYYFPITEFTFHGYNMLSCAIEGTKYFSCLFC